MTRQFLSHRLFAAAVAVSVSCAAPTPRLTDGPPDLTGTWGHAVVFGLDFVRGETLADGSVCVFG